MSEKREPSKAAQVLGTILGVTLIVAVAGAVVIGLVWLAEAVLR